MTKEPAAVARSVSIREALEEAGIPTRLLGGVGVYVLCPSSRPPSALARHYSDVDVVTARRSSAAVAEVLAELGVEPAKRFNALHGKTRLLFTFADGMKVDVFVGRFAMCHNLDLSKRLETMAEVITPADLLLTKLQIAELTKRDVSDLCALFLDWPLSETDDGINQAYVSKLLAQDWGWWRTVTENLDRLLAFVPDIGLDQSQEDEIRGSVEDLRSKIDSAPRSRKWRWRDALGDRIPWRDEPGGIEA